MHVPWVFHFADEIPAGHNGRDWKEFLGGKGASLKQMTAGGLRVPTGFTISTDCCARFFELGRRWPEGLEDEVRRNLRRLEEETGRKFGCGERPLLVSVRSGAARSMPGMMDTLLNCGLHPGLAEEVGDTPEFWTLYVQFVRMFAKTVHGIEGGRFDESIPGRDGPKSRGLATDHLRVYESYTGTPFPTSPWDVLVQCINAVFDSWHSERAVAYRQKNDIHGLRGTAVTVQIMFPSEVSGIVFTEDPTTLDARRMIIESSLGLGEAVVSGDVTPDRFLVNRDNPEDVRTELGRKGHVVMALALGAGGPKSGDFGYEGPSLTPPQIRELTELAFRVERYFGHPVDIEWGLAHGQFALLQARPIRGLDVARDVEIGRQEEIHRLKTQLGGRRRVWVTHNLAETLRFPTPLTWDIVRAFMRGSGGFGRLYRDLGYRPSRAVCDDGFLDLIGGRIYADPGRLAELFWDGMPLTYDLDALVRDKRLLDHAPTKFDADRADGRFLATLPGNLWGMWRATRRTRSAARDAKRRFDHDILPPYLEFIESSRRMDLGSFPVEKLLDILHGRIDRVLHQFGPESLKPGYFGGLALDRLERLLVQLLGEPDGPALANTLTRALDGDTTFEQDAMLFRVARGEATLPDFLTRFGHRCIGEMELMTPRWRENPAYLEQTLVRLRSPTSRNPETIHHDNLEKRRDAESSLPATLATWGGSSFLEPLLSHLADARALLPYRESGKHYLMLGYELIRQTLEELSRRYDLGNGLYFLRLDELPLLATDRSRLSDQIAQRRIRWQSLQRLDMPEIIDSTSLDDLGLTRSLPTSDELTGTPIAAGVSTGIARIVIDPASAGDLGTDYILVCPSTDPGWTPLFMNARGLIVERGGVLSHGAIVARDFGIPALVLPQATRLLPPGSRLRLDGNHGRVVVVARG